jgi:hypothetical protein
MWIPAKTVPIRIRFRSFSFNYLAVKIDSINQGPGVFAGPARFNTQGALHQQGGGKNIVRCQPLALQLNRRYSPIN